MAHHIVTKESLTSLVLGDKGIQAVGRALVVLFKNQTNSEQEQNSTNLFNGVGFTGADAHSGSLTAKYFIKHNTLEPWMYENWIKPSSSGFPRIAKYWKQLDFAAQAKHQKAVA